MQMEQRSELPSTKSLGRKSEGQPNSTGTVKTKENDLKSSKVDSHAAKTRVSSGGFQGNNKAEARQVLTSAGKVCGKSQKPESKQSETESVTVVTTQSSEDPNQVVVNLPASLAQLKFTDKKAVLETLKNLSTALKAGDQAKPRDGTVSQQIKEVFKCAKCDYCSHNKHYLKQHVDLVHNAERPFKCPFCDYAGKRSHSLKEHLVVHSTYRPYECSYCNATFRKKGHLTNHIKMHATKKVFECTMCLSTFNDRSVLYRHLRIKHPSEDVFACEVCDYATTIKSNIVMHMHTHGNPKTYKCDVCNFTALHINILKKHMRNHDSPATYHVESTSTAPAKPLILLKCSECGYTTDNKVTLRDHMWEHVDSVDKSMIVQEDRVHSPTEKEPVVAVTSTGSSTSEVSTIYKCAECSFTSREAYVFITHMLSHKSKHQATPAVNDMRHETASKSINEAQKEAEIALKQGFTHDKFVGLFTCTICGYTCEHQRTIKAHIWKHSGHKDVDYPMFRNGPLSMYENTPVTIPTQVSDPLVQIQTSLPKKPAGKPEGNCENTTKMTSHQDTPTLKGATAQSSQDSPKLIELLKSKSHRQLCELTKQSTSREEQSKLASHVNSIASATSQTVSKVVTSMDVHSTVKKITDSLFSSNVVRSQELPILEMVQEDGKSAALIVIEEVTGATERENQGVCTTAGTATDAVHTMGTEIISVDSQPGRSPSHPDWDTHTVVVEAENCEPPASDKTTVLKNDLQMLPDETSREHRSPVRPEDSATSEGDSEKVLISHKNSTREESGESQITNSVTANEFEIIKMVLENAGQQTLHVKAAPSHGIQENQSEMQSVETTVGRKVEKQKRELDDVDSDMMGVAKKLCSGISTSSGNVLVERVSQVYTTPRFSYIDSRGNSPRTITDVTWTAETIADCQKGHQLVSKQLPGSKEHTKSKDKYVSEDEDSSDKSMHEDLSDEDAMDDNTGESQLNPIQLPPGRTSGATDQALTLLSLLKKGPNYNPAYPMKTQSPEASEGSDPGQDGDCGPDGIEATKPRKGICSSLLAVIEQLRERSKSESDGDEATDVSQASNKSTAKRRSRRNSLEDETPIENYEQVEKLDGDGPYRCKLCHYSSTSTALMKTHMRLHKTKQPFECSLCDFIAESSENLQDHMIQHCKVRTYQCKMCPSVFSYKSQLRAHMRAHNEKDPMVCEYCDFETMHPMAYKNHMKGHKDKENFKCPKCQVRFVGKNDFELHECGPAAMQVNEKNAQGRHVEDGQPEKHPSLSRSNSSEASTQGQSVGVADGQPLKCELCDFIATSSRSLKSHMKRHVNDQRFVQQPLEQYKCNLCGYVCHHLPSLKSHMWRHASDKSYSYQSTNDIINAAIDFDSFTQPGVPAGCTVTVVTQDTSDSTPSIQEQPCLVTFRCCQCGYETTDKALLNDHMKQHMDIIQKTLEVNHSHLAVEVDVTTTKPSGAASGDQVVPLEPRARVIPKPGGNGDSNTRLVVACPVGRPIEI